MNTIREKLYWLGKVAATYLLYLVSGYEVKCEGPPLTHQQVIASQLIAFSVLATLAYYWLLWVVLSSETFARYRCSSILLAAIALDCFKLAYSASLCDQSYHTTIR